MSDAVAWPDGLAEPTPEFWQQTVLLQVDLLTAMAIHGNLLLSLRHPANNGMSRVCVEAAVRTLGLLLIEAGALTGDRWAAIERDELGRAPP